MEEWETTLKKNADVSDTLKYIVDCVNEYSHYPFAKEAAKGLKEIQHNPGNPHEFLQLLFNWACDCVDYKLDKWPVEDIHTPFVTFLDGVGDCKKFSILLGCVLVAAGYEPVFKHVEYDGVKFTHIYVIVPNSSTWNPHVTTDYTVLDCTNNCNFNSEVPHDKSTIYFLNGDKMEIKMRGTSMGNSNWKAGKSNFSSSEIADHCNTVLHHVQDLANATPGTGKIHLKFNMAPPHLNLLKKLHPQDILKALHPSGKLPNWAPKIAHIPIEHQRGAFRTLIQHNVDNIATHLATVLSHNPKAFDNVWKMVGGDLASFKKDVLESAHKPAISSDTEMPIGEWLENAGVGKGFFKKILAGAAHILHAVAPIANAIIPGAGAALETVANKAAQLAGSLPTNDPKAPGHIDPPKDIPPDPAGARFGVGTGGNTTFIGMSMLASSLANHLHISHFIASLIITTAFLIYANRFGYFSFKKGFIKKVLNFKIKKSWQNFLTPMQ